MGRFRGWSGLGAGLLALWPAVSQAQFFVQTETSTTYLPLVSLPGINGVTDFAFSSNDDGRATLPLPFAFRFLGTPYTELRMTVNGALVFGSGRLPSYSNAPIGSSSSPNNMIAMWWDDLIIPAASGHSNYGVIGSAPNRIFVIEVRDWEHYSLGRINDGRVQVWLYEGLSGRFDVRYDRLLTDTDNYSATAGWEGDTADGEPNGLFRACSAASPYCTAADYAGMSARVFTVAQAEGPELTGSVGDFGRGGLPGETVNVPVSLQNLGTQDASNVDCELYLSLDGSLDVATDIRVANFTVPLISITAPQDITVPALVPVNISAGDYYLLVSVDAPNAVTEPSEQNNVGVAAARFATAYDFGAVSVRAPVGARPGQSLQVELTVENRGVPYNGALPVRVVASVNRTIDARDLDLATLSPQLTGANPQLLTLAVPLPANMAAGGYFVGVTLDPSLTLRQIDPTDNEVISVSAFPNAPDLVPVQVQAPTGAMPGAALPVDLVIRNDGLPYSGPVNVRFISSPDPIYDLNDRLLGDLNSTLNLASGQSQTLPVTLTVPALAASNYYVIANVDPLRQVAEVSDFNNTRVSDDTFAAAPDLSVLDIVLPRVVGPGELVSYETRIASTGAAYTGPVSYGLYASEDRTFDSSDIFVGLGTVSFAGQAEVTGQLDVNFPVLEPGDYYIGARIDPAGVLSEADETNNTFVDATRFETGPDFGVFSVAVSPSTAVPGDTITVTYRVRNYGSAYTGDLEYRIYLSEDYRLDAGDIPAFDGVYILAGELNSVTVTSTFTLARNVAPVTYRAIVYVDPDERIPEQRDNNNDDDSSSRLQVQGSNPQVAALIAGPVAFVGRPYDVQVDLVNSGALDAVDLQVGLYLSGAGVLLQGTTLGLTPGVSVPAQGAGSVSVAVDVPSTTRPGDYLFGAQVDPQGLISEEDERDNLYVQPELLRVMMPAPDLQCQVIHTATSAAPGEPLAITRLLTNTGVADAPSFGLQYVLSEDAVIDAGDLRIGTASTSLAQGGDDYSIDIINVPLSVRPGRYWLGLIVDANSDLTEVYEDNNSALGPQLTVHAPGLQVLNRALPSARLGAQYEVMLFATGATEALGWSLVQGSLPMGLVLDQVSGMIRGTARAEGRFNFVVQVRSGGPVAQQALELEVLSATAPLELVSAPLVSAILGRDYDAQLIAVGGRAPYQFTAVSSLPLGLQLDAQGRLSGAPRFVGSTEVRFRVDDRLGASASASLVLRVIRTDHRLLIVQAALPTGRIDSEYCEADPVQLTASGGTEPYVWTLTSTAPAGLALNADGTLCGVPTQAGSYAVGVQVKDAGGLIDSSIFVVKIGASNAFVITSVGLPNGEPGIGYGAQLQVNGAIEAVVWRMELGTLPEGLTLSEQGLIEGVPTQVQTTAFVVSVQDGQGQFTRRPMAIQIEDKAVVGEGGCRCVNRAPGPASLVYGLVLVFGLCLRRRRRGGRQIRLPAAVRRAGLRLGR